MHHLCIYKKIHDLTFDVDPDGKIKVTQNVAQFPLHYVIYAPAKFAGATFNSLGESIYKTLVEGRTDRWTEERWTDFGKKFISPFF